MLTSSSGLRVARCALALLAASLFCTRVEAAFNYGDHHGASVGFINVREASVTTAGMIYGPPTVNLDTLSFDLLGVGAFNINASEGGVDMVGGQLFTTITAKPGNWITHLAITEHGDFSLTGNGTATTYA